MKWIMKALAWLLCAVVFAGAVACSGQKSASGKKSPDTGTLQQKSVVTDCPGREKAGSSLDCAPDKVVVENNALSDIAENQASGMTQQEKYQKAQDALVKATEEFKAQNCAGLSAEACGAKMDAHRDELLKGFADAGLDFVPVVGTIKTVAEAQSALDYLLAAATIIPGERIASGILKSAEKALKKGDIDEAAKLINKASDEISAKTPTGSKGNPLNVIDGQNKPAIIGSRDYSGHSLDRMQKQGITPTTVENTIRPENAIVGKRPGTTAYYDDKNNITVITDTKTGTVVTVDFGRIKQ